MLPATQQLVKDTIVYDCETKKPVPPSRSQELWIPGIEYCKGWTDYTGMGISVISVFEFNTDTMHTFDPDNIFHQEKFQKMLDESICVVGFNNRRFDDNLIRNNGFILPDELTYDIYASIQHIKGKYAKDCNLSNLAQVNRLGGKKGSGALAPVLYQRGQIEELHAYCNDDVYKTKELYIRVLEARLLDPNDGRYMLIPRPTQICPF